MKSLPFHKESEQALLGCLLNSEYSSETWVEISLMLSANDFYMPAHKVLFEAVDFLDKKGSKVDAVTVADYLNKDKQLEKIGGVNYLKELIDQITSPSYMISYAKIIKEKSQMRKVISIFQEGVNKTYEQDFSDFGDFINDLEGKFYELHSPDKEASLQKMSSFLSETIDRLEALSEQKSKIIGVPTGFLELDDKTSGLHPGELSIIAARPSMGKTALGLNIALHASLKENKKVAFFSVEMSKETIMFRLLSLLTKVPLSNLRSGNLNEQQWSQLMSFTDQLEKCPLFINDMSGVSPYDIRSQARHMKIKTGLDLIIVDYLQMMSLKGRTESREREVSEMSRTLKSIAKELKVPVVSLAQLNRGVESRSNRRPLLSDLRESGSIEQDSDVIMLMYRDGYYNSNTPEPDVTEIIIGKQRNGPTGLIKLKWKPQFGAFEDYVDDQIDPKPPIPESPFETRPSSSDLENFAPESP